MRKLLGESGIVRSTTVVLYGDNNNWFATYAFWQMRMFGHKRLKIMNGGRVKWIAEGRPMTTEAPSYPARTYRASDPDPSIRATRDYVLDVASTSNNVGLVDVRAPAESAESCWRRRTSRRKALSEAATSQEPRTSRG